MHTDVARYRESGNSITLYAQYRKPICLRKLTRPTPNLGRRLSPSPTYRAVLALVDAPPQNAPDTGFGYVLPTVDSGVGMRPSGKR